MIDGGQCGQKKYKCCWDMLQEWYGRFFDIAMYVRTNGAGNDDGGVVLGARDYKVHVHGPRLPQATTPQVTMCGLACHCHPTASFVTFPCVNRQHYCTFFLPLTARH